MLDPYTSIKGGNFIRREDLSISIDQALIIALKMHDRGHCNLFRAILTGLQLRYQLNFLDELGISLDSFRDMINEAQNEKVI